MLSIGLDPKPSSSRPNGTQMRQDRLKEADKRSGAKQGEFPVDSIHPVESVNQNGKSKTNEPGPSSVGVKETFEPEKVVKLYLLE